MILRGDNVCYLFPMCCVLGVKDGGTADEYFNKIMTSTGTIILWPSKLKIGAKSKKGIQYQLGYKRLYKLFFTINIVTTMNHA